MERAAVTAMRKLFMLLLLLMSLALPALAESELPPAIREDIQWSYLEVDIEGWCAMPESGQVLVLAKRPQGRRLLVYAPHGGGWQCVMDVKDGIPQLARDAYISPIPKGESWSTSPETFAPMIAPAEGFSIVVLDEIGEAYEQTVTYFHCGDTYHLAQYSKNITNFCDVEADRLIFWNIGDGFDGVVMQSIETDIKQVAFDRLPAYEYSMIAPN